MDTRLFDIMMFVLASLCHLDVSRMENPLEIQSCRTADCDTDHYLVVAKVRERLAVNKKDLTDIVW
jgi:hypothetical protein